MGKPRVVNILGILSPYWLANEQNAPAVRWDTGGGTWVGIFDQHWSDLLCRAISRVTSAFDLEVWQPDLRADRIYEHTFDDGLKHVLFPASPMGNGHGKPSIDPIETDSPLLMEAIDQIGPGTLLHLNALENQLTEQILRRLLGRQVPVVLHEHGGSTYPTLARHGKNLLRRLHYVLKTAEQRRLARQLSHVVVQSRYSQEDLRQVFSGPISIITMGVDFERWRPGDRRAARHRLGLPEDRFVLLTGSMLRPRKQLHKLIAVLVELDRAGQDFVYLVAGGGDPAYEARLRELARPLALKGKIRFLGHLTDGPLLNAYQAADLFVSVSSSEGAPVAVMKAFACELPVFSTDVWHLSEFLGEHHAGLLVPNSPPVWAERLGQILTGERVPAVPRELARQTYDWPVVARRFVTIYEEVLARHGATSSPFPPPRRGGGG